MEHPDWDFNVEYLEQKGCVVDNYIVFLRRDEIKSEIEPILTDIYGDCKISVLPEWFAPPSTTKDTTSTELLSAAFQGEANCMVIVCYTTAPIENRDADLVDAIQAIQENGYAFTFCVLYTNGEIFEKIPDEHYREFPLDMKRYYCKTRSYIWGKSCWDYEWEEGQLSDMKETD